MNTNASGDGTTCTVCGNFKMLQQEYCTLCYLQKSKIAAMRQQRKRDIAFGNIWEEAGVKDD